MYNTPPRYLRCSYENWVTMQYFKAYNNPVIVKLAEMLTGIQVTVQIATPDIGFNGMTVWNNGNPYVVFSAGLDLQVMRHTLALQLAQCIMHYDIKVEQQYQGNVEACAMYLIARHEQLVIKYSLTVNDLGWY